MVPRQQAWLADDEHLVEVYRANARELLVFFVRRVWEPQIAMDLVAETFAELISQRHRFEGADPDAARRWLYGIAANKLRRFLRDGAIERRALNRVGMEAPRLAEAELERVEELADLGALRARLRGALDRLSREHREALELRVIGEVAYPEMAERLGVSEQTARARVSRGLKRLRAQLDGENDSESEEWDDRHRPLRRTAEPRASRG